MKPVAEISEYVSENYQFQAAYRVFRSELNPHSPYPGARYFELSYAGTEETDADVALLLISKYPLITIFPEVIIWNDIIWRASNGGIIMPNSVPGVTTTLDDLYITLVIVDTY